MSGRSLPLGGARGRIRRAGALAGACLVLALAALWSAPAAAQSETTLVGNTGQGSTTFVSGSNNRAQRFTTGSNTAGYTLSSVDIISDAQGDSFSVSVCTVNASGYPTSTCTALTAPTNFAVGTLTFTASPAIDLDSNTTYTIHLTNVSNVHIGRTSSGAEDAGGAAGWSLQDRYDYTQAGTTWLSLSAHAMRVAIKGTIKGSTTNNAPTVANTIPDQTATVGTAFSYAFPDNTFADADSDTLTYTATLEDGSALPSWLTWTPADRKFEGTPPMTAGGTTLSIKVTATDTNSASVSDTFDIEVRAAGSTPMVGVLVGNIDRGNVALITLRAVHRAQQFTTGSNAGGYAVSSVDVVSVDTEGDSFSVSLCTVDSAGHPTSTCTALTAPQSFAAGTLKFTVSPAFELVRDTRYAIYLSGDGVTSVRLGSTYSNAEDTGGAAGWSLADAYHFLSSGSWSTTSGGEALRVAVNGTVKSAPTVANPIPDQSATVGTAFEYAFPANTFADADNDTLTYTATLDDGSALPSWLTWTPSTRTFSGTPPMTAGGTTRSIRVTATDTNSASVSDTFDIEVRAAGSTPAGSVLVSNIGQGSTSTINSPNLAQRFTTGSNAAGYTVSGIDVVSADAQGDTFDVRLCTVNSQGHVSSASTCTTLTAPGSFPAGTLTFTASPVIDLDSNTTYAIHLTNMSGVDYGRTSSNSEDTGGAAGWSLADAYEFLPIGGSQYVTTATGNSLRVAVRGTVNRGPYRSPRVANRIPDQSAEIGAFFSYVIPENTFSYADGDELRYEARRVTRYHEGRVITTKPLDYVVPGARYYEPPWLKFNAETRTLSGQVPPGAKTTDIRIVARDGRDGQGYADFRLNPTLAPGLVGNLSHIEIDHRRLDWFDHAQKFTTGSHSTGYTVTSVDVYLDKVRHAGNFPEVKIRSGSASGTTVATLTAPGSGAIAGKKLYRYTAPANTVLAASTDYWLTFEGGSARVGRLLSNRVDPGSAAGWSLANVTLRRNTRHRTHPHLNFPNYHASTFHRDTTAMRINGTGVGLEHCDRTDASELWCATMTVGTADTVLGFSSGFGSMNDVTFNYGGVEYEVEEVYVDTASSNAVSIGFDPNGSSVFNSADFKLDLGGTELSFGDATYSSVNTEFEWSSTSISWSDGDRVAVKLVHTPGGQQASEAPTVEGLPVIGGVGGNSVWDAGDTLSVALTFSEAVEVDETGGTPTVSFDLGGTKPRTASYESGSGTTELVFEYEVVAGDGSNSLVSMTGNNVALNGGTIASVATGTDADLSHQGVLVQGSSAGARGDGAPQVTFENLPASHDGSSAFTVEVSFSGAPQGLSAKPDAASVLAVTGGTVTGARDVSLNGQTRWEVTVDPDGTGDVRVRIPARACAETGAVCIGGRALEEDVDATVPGPAITAELTGAPSAHDGSSAFTVNLTFSHAPRGLSFRTVEGGLFDVTGGRISKVGRTTRGQNTGWQLTVTPSTRGDVVLAARATADCAAAHAVCDASGRKFDGSLTATIPGPDSSAQDEPPAPIAASWSSVPAEHGGAAETFDVHLDFSRSPRKGFSYGWLASSVVAVEGGSIARVWRRTKGRNDRWGIEVEPDGWGPVTLTVNGTTDCAASEAVCAADGGMLEGGAEASVAGPVTVSVADAEVQEGPEAALAFTVTLSRAAGEAVTVAYATADDTAAAGSDYTATSGTLGFAADETEKTVSVPVLDDVLDEGAETMTLTLSNPSPSRVKLADAEATGTIRNADPLQKMWLSRFGRTVADHVTTAVSDRLANPPGGARVTVGGQTVDLAESDDAALLGRTLTSLAYLFGAPSGPAAADEDDGSPGSWSPGSRSGAGGAGGAGGGSADAGAPGRLPEGRALLLGSAFHLAKDGERGGPGLAAWGRVTTGGFDGAAPADGGSVRIDGSVITGILGADAAWKRLLAGVAVSISEGEGGFDQPGVDSGTIESTMTTVSPYARLTVNDRLSVWGLAGWGTGDMTITQAANDRGQPERIGRTDLEMRLAALGGRGALLRADEAGGIDLALRGDAFYVETESEAVSNEGGTTGAASRVRLALEGSRAFGMEGGGTLTPGLELGLRHDGGDAETGTGVELGGRVTWTDPETGLGVEARVRTLVAHEDSEYREWGASGAVRLDPGERGRGLSFSLAPTYGAASSGVGRLWSARDARGLAPGGEFEAEGRLEGELGYGLGMFGDRLTGTPNLGFGLSDSARDYRIGWRLTSAMRNHPGFEVGLDATRREAVNGNEPPEHGVMLRGAVRW